MKMAKGFFLVFIFFSALLINLKSSRSVHAISETSEWSPDERVPGYFDDTFTPFLLAGDNGVVYAFASQRIEGSRRSIFYREWSLHGGWTLPIDIILDATLDASFSGAYLDASGVIHIIFAFTSPDQITTLYYSQVPAHDAGMVSAWSSPVTVGEYASNVNGATPAAIIGDSQGNLVIMYGGIVDRNAIYSVISSDSGKSWSEPEAIFLTHNSQLVPFSLHFAMGSNRQVRATWNVVTDLGQDKTLYFANYDMSKSSWSTPIELDAGVDEIGYFGPSFPMIVDTGKQIIIMYNGGNPFSDRSVFRGRPVQLVVVSNDGGMTWSRPSVPFPLLNGRSGEHAMVLDGNNIPHALFVQRIDITDENGNYSSIGGIWYSKFENNVWANPDRFVTSLSPHDIRVAVSQGNILLAVWREDPGEGEHGVWYSYTKLDNVPELQVSPVPTDKSVNLNQGVVTFDVPLPTTTPSPQNVFIDDNRPPLQFLESPALPIIIGITPVILIILFTILGYKLFAKRDK